MELAVMAALLILCDKLQMEVLKQADLLYPSSINLIEVFWELLLGLLCALVCKCSCGCTVVAGSHMAERSCGMC